MLDVESGETVRPSAAASSGPGAKTAAAAALGGCMSHSTANIASNQTREETRKSFTGKEFPILKILVYKYNDGIDITQVVTRAGCPPRGRNRQCPVIIRRPTRAAALHGHVSSVRRSGRESENGGRLHHISPIFLPPPPLPVFPTWALLDAQGRALNTHSWSLDRIK